MIDRRKAGLALAVIGIVVAGASAVSAQDSLFDRTHRAHERAQQQGNVGGPAPQHQGGGRTGYVEQGYNNNTGNNSQSQQLDQLDNQD